MKGRKKFAILDQWGAEIVAVLRQLTIKNGAARGGGRLGALPDPSKWSPRAAAAPVVSWRNSLFLLAFGPFASRFT